MSLINLRKELREKANVEKAKILQRFFKTGRGEYGEGDIFWGITVPESRSIAQKYSHLSFQNIKKLLNSKIHEERLVALLILVHQFQIGDGKQRKNIFDFYLKNTKHVNNWDLIDLTADKIIGQYLLGKSKKILYKLARSPNIWERRIAVVATFQFIRNHQFKTILEISKILLRDKQDLIQKAVGWMLREVGKHSLKTEEDFLKKYYQKMPRTMLRYAIERFPKKKREAYLKSNR